MRFDSKYIYYRKTEDMQMILTIKQNQKLPFFSLIFFAFIISSTLFAHINSQAVDTEDFIKNYDILSAIKGLQFNSEEFINFSYYANQISEKYFQNIRNHIETFASFGSRVTGYPGYEQAVAYISNFFVNQNLSKVQNLSYPLSIPYELGTRIVIDGKNYTVHAFAPNSAHPCKIPSNGLTGPLVYGGLGEIIDLDGKKIENSVVLLEFNTGKNWMNAISLKAKAVIFLPPQNSNRNQAEAKSVDIPLNFPRIYINNETTAKTIKEFSLKSNYSITLYSDIDWKSIEAKNVMGLLPGLDDDTIIISAHFDSSSMVPSIAPGADEACGIATLLELIKIMREEKITPQKTIMFLALSGHNQAAAGAREFVFQNYDFLNKKGGIKLFLSLDLSASNNIIGINPYGGLYRFQLKYTFGNKLYSRLKTVGEDFLIQYESFIQEATDSSFEVESYINIQDIVEYSDQISYFGDHEPFIASNVLALSLYTTHSSRIHFNTPFDLPQYLEYDMLESQVVYSYCALVQLVVEENLDTYLDLEHKDFSLKPTTYVGFGNIEGYCKEYNETTTWLSDIANAVIRVTTLDTNTKIKGIYSYYTRTDENGYYQIRGVSSSQPDNPLEFFVEAYVFDSEGNLIKAPNLGLYGQFFKPSKKLASQIITINPTVFSCGTIGLFQVFHPYTQSPATEVISYEVLNPTTKSQLFSYGYLGEKSVSLVFVPPGKPSTLVGKYPDGVLGVFATNSSTETLRGNGFLVREGEFKNLGSSTLITIKDIRSLTQKYIERLKSYSIYDDQVIETFQRASHLIDSVIQLMKNYEYSMAFKTMNNAQIWTYDALSQARAISSGTISTAILFAFLLIPFAFVLSQLLFDINSSIKWVLTSSIIYGLTFSSFYFIHPAFQIAPHLILTLIGIINVVSSFFVILWLYQEGYDYLKSQRSRILGSHFPTGSILSEILIAGKTGISRMKKHKIRAFIHLSSIALLTFSLTLYTSASALIRENILELTLPIAIAILLLINTSLSSVHASKREIFVFTSLGLSPANITDLFLTEFFVSTIIGSIAGYFGGIGFIRVVSILGLISGTLPINYTSEAVIATLVFSAMGMSLSILYPLRLSAQLSVPSLMRNWELTTPPKEDGTEWNIPLPIVTSSEQEAEGIIVFLREFFLIYESENIGGQFFVSNIIVKNFRGKKKQMNATVNLAPFDMGIKQNMTLITYFDEVNDQWVFEIKLIRLEGVLMAWQAAVRRFIGQIRRQFLIWKSLSKDKKMGKIEEFSKIFPDSQ